MEVTQTVPQLGRLVAPQRGEVAAQVAGAVETMRVRVGDRVAVGDELAIIDEGRLAARLDLANARALAADATVSSEKAQLELLEQERRRLERLRQSAAFSPAQLDDKAMEINGANAQIARAEALSSEAQAELDIASKDLEDARVTAPYGGVVVSRYVSAGDYVQVGEPVVVLVNDRELEVEIDLPSDKAHGLREGQVLAATMADGRAINVEFRALVPDENPLTRTLAARFNVDTSAVEGVLAPGQSVTLNIPIGATGEVLTVHKDAVLRRQGQDRVFIAAADGQATPRVVQLGVAVGARFEVREGLAEGDLVVIRGNERLRPGQQITYDPPAPAETAS